MFDLDLIPDSSIRNFLQHNQYWEIFTNCKYGEVEPEYIAVLQQKAKEWSYVAQHMRIVLIEDKHTGKIKEDFTKIIRLAEFRSAWYSMQARLHMFDQGMMNSTIVDSGMMMFHPGE